MELDGEVEEDEEHNGNRVPELAEDRKDEAKARVEERGMEEEEEEEHTDRIPDVAEEEEAEAKAEEEEAEAVARKAKAALTDEVVRRIT